jgi:hypothetical protein
MGFAPYFGKNLQAASFLLQGINPDAFKEVLSREVIGIAFDRKAAQTAEGRASLDLAIRLLARLYPSLAVIPCDAVAKRYARDLVAVATAVNPNIEVRIDPAAQVSRCLVIGNTPALAEARAQQVFVGSDGWLCRLSKKSPVGSGASRNPFGAGAAACLGVANLFRATFAENLPNPEPDEDVIFSTLEMAVVADSAANPGWTDADLGELFLVGSGAIGNGLLWSLRDIQARGTLHVIDGETVDLTNLQRYVMTISSDEGNSKTELAEKWLLGSGLKVDPHPQHWNEFVAARANWHFERVIVAVDTERARIEIQASLPRGVHNAWTQRGEVGISRHQFLGPNACMACLYVPTQPAKNLDQLVLEALRLPDGLLMEIRARLDQGKPTEREFLQLIAREGAIPFEELLAFEGKKLEELYHKGVCGGMVMALREGETMRRAEVPMAFQSAFAGVLLAADTYAELAGLREPLPTRTQINLLTALPVFSPSDTVPKSSHGRCVCADTDFIEAYVSRYGTEPKAAKHEKRTERRAPRTARKRPPGGAGSPSKGARKLDST